MQPQRTQAPGTADYLDLTPAEQFFADRAITRVVEGLPRVRRVQAANGIELIVDSETTIGERRRHVNDLGGDCGNDNESSGNRRRKQNSYSRQARHQVALNQRALPPAAMPEQHACGLL